MFVLVCIFNKLIISPSTNYVYSSSIMNSLNLSGFSSFYLLHNISLRINQSYKSAHNIFLSEKSVMQISAQYFSLTTNQPL
jgi:hypothetical protein